ncbi:MAG: hypothetical protein ICV65_07425 [Flavisolibacter sp.]|nr:hypothetical protein [Flavisolibacter sp.]
MKKISIWAHEHKWMARFIIIALYFLLTFIGHILGELLLTVGIHLPLFTPYLLLIPFFIAFIFYPSYKEKEKYKNIYRARKAADSIMACTTFLMVVSMANQSFLDRSAQPASLFAASPVSPAAEEIDPVKPKGKHGFSLKEWRKALRKNVQALRKELRAIDEGGKTGLIVLSIVVAVVLLFLLSAVSCGIACNGSEGLALAVLLLGAGLIIFLLAKIIYRIKHGPKRPSIREPAAEKEL